MVGTNAQSHEYLLSPLLGTGGDLKNYQDILKTIKEMVGCELQVFESVTSNEFKIHVGQTSRFVDHYSPTELQEFHTKCRQLVTCFSTQGLELKNVIKKLKRVLEKRIPLFCHANIGISSCDTEVALIVVLDRPLAPENRSNALTILNDYTLDQLSSIEGSSEITVEKVKVSTLSPAVIDNVAPKEVSPPEVEVDQLDPDERTCMVLVEEIKILGTDYWVCQYLETITGFQPNGTQIINNEIKVLVSSGTLKVNRLRALVWLGLGAEKNRNLLDLSFGRFLIIRSNENQQMVAIAKLE